MSYIENYEKLIERFKSIVFEGKTFIVDGPDFSGKSTLINRLLKETSVAKTNFFSNRGILTNIVYSDFYNRKLNIEKQMSSLKRQLQSNKFVYIILLPNNETLKSRLSRGDEFIKNENDVIAIADIFRSYALQLMSYSNVIIVSEKVFVMQDNFDSVNEVVFDWKTIVHSLGDFQNLYNYNLNYLFSGIELINMTEQLPYHYQNLNNSLKGFTEFKNKNYALTYKKDIYDQEMLLSQLKFNSHIQMDVFNQTSHSRRFIASNIISCLTNYQVNIDNSLNFHISANFRSSDAINLLLHDINFIFKAAIDFHNFLNNYTFKNIAVKTLADTDFSFDINLNNVHIRKF